MTISAEDVLYSSGRSNAAVISQKEINQATCHIREYGNPEHGDALIGAMTSGALFVQTEACTIETDEDIPWPSYVWLNCCGNGDRLQNETYPVVGTTLLCTHANAKGIVTPHASDLTGASGRSYGGGISKLQIRLKSGLDRSNTVGLGIFNRSRFKISDVNVYGFGRTCEIAGVCLNWGIEYLGSLWSPWRTFYIHSGPRDGLIRRCEMTISGADTGTGGTGNGACADIHATAAGPVNNITFEHCRTQIGAHTDGEGEDEQTFTPSGCNGYLARGELNSVIGGNKVSGVRIIAPHYDFGGSTNCTGIVVEDGVDTSCGVVADPGKFDGVTTPYTNNGGTGALRVVSTTLI